MKYLPIISLALIGTGCWFIYRPMAPLAVGVLIWLDLTIRSLRVRAHGGKR